MEIAKFSDFFPNSLTRKVAKGTILLQQGQKARYSYQVESGCLKSYVTDEDGKEHIVQFAPEDWLISDMNSITNDVPAAISIAAIEDSVVVFLPKTDEKPLKITSHELLYFENAKMRNNIIAVNKRLIHLLSSSATTRYLDFMATYPTLHQRLPLKLVASYLGITPEFLSRIRKHLAEKK